jgi:hypothetical protein
MSLSTEPRVQFEPSEDDDLVLDEWLEDEDDIELELLDLDET